jgi:hypothetical protein
MLFASVHESADGPERTYEPHTRMSALRGKADIGARPKNVRS